MRIAPALALVLVTGLAAAQPAMPASGAASSAHADCPHRGVARHEHGAEKGMPSAPRSMPCAHAPGAAASAPAGKSPMRHDHNQVHKTP